MAHITTYWSLLSLNTYIKQAVLQLSRGGQALLTCENFAITVSKPDSPIESEGIASERKQGLISNTSMHNQAESQEPQNIDAADPGPNSPRYWNNQVLF